MFRSGDYVHKKTHHRFQGHVISVGENTAGQEIVTVQHYPEEWIFHFRGDQLKYAEIASMDTRGK